MAYNEWMKERHAAGLTAPYSEYRELVRQRAREAARERAAKKAKTPKLKTTDDFLQALLRRAEARAEKKGWKFDLDEAWVQEHMASGKCEVTGICFGIGGSKSPWQPSIDRIDSDKGYTKDNCQMVVWIYNRAKADGTHQNVMLMARALVRGEN